MNRLISDITARRQMQRRDSHSLPTSGDMDGGLFLSRGLWDKDGQRSAVTWQHGGRDNVGMDGTGMR